MKSKKRPVSSRSGQKRRTSIVPIASKDTPLLPSPSGNNGLTNDELVRLLARPPDPSSAQIRGQIISILLDGNLSATQQRARISEAVVLAVAERGQFFFDREQRDFGCTMFFDADRKRLERISGDPFHAWLSDWLRINRADSIFTHIISEIQTVALNEKYSKGIVPEKFWAARSDVIYLSNGDAQLVKITADGVAISDNGTDSVLFVAGDTLNPWQLVDPENPFQACSVFRKASFSSPHGFDEVVAWAMSIPCCPKNKPPLCCVGPIGSGKTRLAMSISELYGVPVVANNVNRDGDGDFWVGVNAGGISILDNCDTRVRWLADAIAAHATGGHRDKRQLYTDAQRIILRARAWLALTTSNPTFASDPGLTDRLLVVRMDRRTAGTDESKLSDEILVHRDAGLSFICQTLRAALADKKPVPAGLNHRHPDFAAFAVRIGRAIARESEFVAMLHAAEEDKSMFCLQNDYVASVILELIEREETFTGTAAQLREKLDDIDPQFVDKNGKPTAKSIGKRLNALWPHLEKVLDVQTEENRDHINNYSLRRKNAEEMPF
jgi:hypothetical protein